MLISAPPIANGPIAAPPGQPPAPADDGQAFAQALDRASARQRDAAAGENANGANGASRDGQEGHDGHDGQDGRGAAATAAAPAQAPGPASAPAPSPASASTKASRKGGPADCGLDATDPRRGAVSRSATRQAPGEARPDVAAEDLTASQPEGLPLRPESEDDTPPAGAADADALPALELAAWVCSLPLPRQVPATAPAAAAAAPPTTSPILSRGGVTAIEGAPAAAAACVAEGIAGSGVIPDGAPSTPALGAGMQAASARQADATGTRHSPVVAADIGAKGREAAADGLMQALTAPRDMSARPSRGIDDSGATAPLPGSWPAGQALPTDRAAPWQAELKAAVGSKEFAPALGSQLNVMVRDGVEHAHLKLNPADLGPIEVRIRLDGTQAQVDFSAAHAATRQALQEAVPALAGALRENGLTLTGGGVFEQPREQRGEARQDSVRSTPGAHGGAADSPTSPTPAPRLPRARGVVDLYA
jgi:flagellar hook-length control protein FliK